MKSLKKSSLICILILFASVLSMAQSFTVNVSSDSVLLGNKIKVTFVVENLEGDFTASDFTDFIVHSGPNQSSQFSTINGHQTSKASYSFIIEPKSEGITYIPPAYLDQNGEVLETEAIRLDVYPNPDGIIVPIEEDGIWQQFNFQFDPFFFEQEQKPKSIEKEKKKDPFSNRKLKKI